MIELSSTPYILIWPEVVGELFQPSLIRLQDAKGHIIPIIEPTGDFGKIPIKSPTFPRRFITITGNLHLIKDRKIQE
jgi:hypothetical protein